MSEVSESHKGNKNREGTGSPNANNMGQNRGIAITGASPLVQQMVAQRNPGFYNQPMSGSPDGNQQAIVAPMQFNTFQPGNEVQTRFAPSTNYGTMRVKSTEPFALMPNNQVSQGVQPAMQPNVQQVNTPSESDYMGVNNNDPYNGVNSPILEESQAKQVGGTQLQGNASNVQFTQPNTDVSKSDLAQLQEAMYGSPSDEPEYQKDDTKKDGGFFNWVGNVFKPKGKREDETDEEYDYRISQNKSKMAVLADALRHLGNIYNTNRYAPLQVFNSPTDAIEKGYKERKANRMAEDKIKADREYKHAKMAQDARKNELDSAYKDANLKIKLDANNRAADRDKALDDYRKNTLKIQQDNAERSKAKDERDFKYKQDRDKVKDAQFTAKQALGWYNATHKKGSGDGGGSGSGSGKAQIATPYGHLDRKSSLNALQERQAYDYLDKHGWLTADFKNKYNKAIGEDKIAGVTLYDPASGSSSKARQIIQGAIAFGANEDSKRGVAFRKYLKEHLGFTESQTTNTSTGHVIRKKNVSKPKTPTTKTEVKKDSVKSKPQAKPQSKVQSKATSSVTQKSNNNYTNTRKLGL